MRKSNLKVLISLKLKSVILVLLFLSPLSANAGLLGTEVGCSITPTPFWVCDQPTNIVGAGAEFELELPQSPDIFGFSVDISDTSILISNIEDNTFGLGANELLTLAFASDVLGVSNFLASGVTVISGASVSVIDNLVSIDLNSGSSWAIGSTFSFDIRTAPVPVPATLALFGLGLAGLGWTRRKAA